MSSMKNWEKKVLSAPGAEERVSALEEEFRVAAGLTALREQAGLSQRQLADRIGVSQPRVAAIERSHNVTLDVLEKYVGALDGHLEVTVIRGNEKFPLITAPSSATRRTKPNRNAPRRAPSVPA